MSLVLEGHHDLCKLFNTMFTVVCIAAYVHMSDHYEVILVYTF